MLFPDVPDVNWVSKLGSEANPPSGHCEHFLCHPSGFFLELQNQERTESECGYGGWGVGRETKEKEKEGGRQGEERWKRKEEKEGWRTYGKQKGGNARRGKGERGRERGRGREKGNRKRERNLPRNPRWFTLRSRIASH